MSEHGLTADQIDTSQPHPARMYDYYLGGRDNYEIDRMAADQVIKVVPEAVDSARQNRAFMRRAVRAIVGEYGIRQIVDIGTGIPTSPNAHEVAQSIAPETCVVYLDNDVITGVHANARLTGVGRTTFMLGDVRQPASILALLHDSELIDFSRPVGLLLVAVMHFVSDAENPYELVAELRDALPSGSFLVFSHATADTTQMPLECVERMKEVVGIYKSTATSLSLRTIDEVRGFFEGFRLIEPGVSSVALWRPDDPEARCAGVHCGVAYKP